MLIFAADPGISPQVWAFITTGGLGLAIGALVNHVIRLWTVGYEFKRTARTDALNEWQKIVSKQDLQIEAQAKRIGELDRKMSECTQANIEGERHHSETREKLARQEGVVEALTQDVRRLELIAQVAPPPTIAPCVMTISLEDGIIRACSPASGPLLGWLPQDLTGKSVAILVPSDQTAAFSAAMDEVRSGKKQVPTRALHVQAVKRAGEMTAVQVQLAQWTTPKGSVMVNADIRPEVNPAIGMTGRGEIPTSAPETPPA